MKLSFLKICCGFTIGLVLGAIVTPVPVRAADDFAAELQKQQQAIEQMEEDFQQYKEEQDRQFADFLQGQWSELETFQGKRQIRKPKPKEAPVKTPGPSHPPVAAPLPIPAVVPPPLPPRPKPVPLSAQRLEIQFYGDTVSFPFDVLWQKYRLAGGAKPELMSAFWAMMSGSKYQATIQSINREAEDIELDDWGRVTLWQRVVEALQPHRKSEQNLLLWYFLVKSGYAVRLGYVGGQAYVFLAVKQPIYGTKYIRSGTQDYYAVLEPDRGKSIHQFYTYQAAYPGKLVPVNIRSATTGFDRPLSAQRALSFEYRGKKIALHIPYDRRVVEYENTFPQTQFELYFDTGASPILRKGLLDALRAYTASMSQEEKVNFLLAFVQKAFPYKTDQDQFGHEKYFFVEESLYYPYNDCEDRAVLFSWLVRELARIPVVGLLYPDHVTTAVALDRIRPGFATVTYRGRRYVIADPTYIGASVGEPMPSYARLKPTRFIEIR